MILDQSRTRLRVGEIEWERDRLHLEEPVSNTHR
jgi:hypothetical protein